MFSPEWANWQHVSRDYGWFFHLAFVLPLVQHDGFAECWLHFTSLDILLIQKLVEYEATKMILVFRPLITFFHVTMSSYFCTAYDIL
jgi:hypothetical protein